ncbi:MAG: glycosyltransferase, partial [Anaerolineae bacterium]
MKVLLVSHKFPPYSLGGVEVYTRHLAHALAGMPGGEYQVAVFFRHEGDRVPGDGRSFAEHDAETEAAPRTGGVHLNRVALYPSGLRASVAGEFLGTFLNRDVESSFVRFLERFQPDLIHCWLFAANAYGR